MEEQDGAAWEAFLRSQGAPLKTVCAHCDKPMPPSKHPLCGRCQVNRIARHALTPHAEVDPWM